MNKDYEIGIKILISHSEGTMSVLFLLPTKLDIQASNLEVEKLKTFYMSSFEHLIEEIKDITSQTKTSIKEDKSYLFFFKASLDWKQKEKLIRGFLESIIKEEGGTPVTYH